MSERHERKIPSPEWLSTSNITRFPVAERENSHPPKKTGVGLIIRTLFSFLFSLSLDAEPRK